MTHLTRLFLSFTLCIGAQTALAATVFINELHYDNAGGDVGEGVEIAGTAGTDLAGYQLLFYNGSNGAVYESLDLSGVIDNEQGGFGAVFFEIAGLQNGGPDGVALIDGGGMVVQFLSYEGSFLAKSGAAAGLASTDIGVSEDGANPVGSSLQPAGFGSAYADFTWSLVLASSYGDLNAGQTFAAPVPLPAALPALAGALLSFGWLRRR